MVVLRLESNTDNPDIYIFTVKSHSTDLGYRDPGFVVKRIASYRPRIRGSWVRSEEMFLPNEFRIRGSK